MRFMVSLKNGFLNMSIKNKLILIIVPVTAVLLVSFSIFYGISKKEAIEKSMQYNHANLRIMINEIENIVNHIDFISLKITSDNNIQEYMQQHNDAYKGENLANNAVKVFSQIEDRYISSIFLISDRKKYLYYDKGLYVFDINDRESFVNEIYEDNKNRHYIGFNQPLKEYSRKIIPFVRPVFLTYGSPYDRKAILVLNIRNDFLGKIIGTNIYDNELFFFFNKYGEIIYNYSGQDKKNEFDYDSICLQELRDTVKINNTEYLVIRNEVKDQGWTIVKCVPLSNIYNEIHKIKVLFILITLATIIVIICLEHFIIQSISTRMNELLRIMKIVEQGNLDCKFDVIYSDEISKIGHYMNNMVDKMKINLLEKANIEVRKKEAEFEALSSQINPHFLCNTLETIRMTAIKNDDKVCADMIKTLSNLFRYCISNAKEFVYVEQEIEYLSNYMSIQQARYRNRLSTWINIDPMILKAKIPKLTLQPIVENAICHGIELKVGWGIVSIDGVFEDNIIKFIVKDNGVGINERKLVQLREELSLVKRDFHMDTSRSIGLKNVNDRIKLNYGEEYGVSNAAINDSFTGILNTI
jgi:sensor histidine kinase YesM